MPPSQRQGKGFMMAHLFSITNHLFSLGGKPSSPNDLDGDDVYPVPFIDNTGPIRDSIITYTFRYDCILAPWKLHDSLVQLLNQNGWRKLGGRLRRNNAGQLAIHVPRKDQGHSVVRFSHVSYDVQINEHELGSQLPQSTGRFPSIQEGCHTFRTFSVPPDLPNNIKHYLTTEEPLLSLRIVSFTDATLVSITFPHAVTDAMGTASLLRAWSSILASPADSIPPILGAKADVMAHVGMPDDREAQKPFVLEHQRIQGMSFLSLILQVAWDRLTRRNIHARTIYLPADFVARLRQSAHLESQSSGPPPRQENLHPPFLSDGDLITAWGARMVISSRSRGKPVIILNVFDLRSRINGLSDPAGVYLQNLILPITAVLPAVSADHPALSVGDIARRIRHAITEQATDVQARRLMRVGRATIARTGMMPLFGSPGATLIGCTNWSKARFREAVQLGPAVVPGRATTAGHPGPCVAFAGTTMGTSDNPRDTFVIYGKDDEGNYWLHAYLRQETWDLIQEVFDEYKNGGGEIDSGLAVIPHASTNQSGESEKLPNGETTADAQSPRGARLIFLVLGLVLSSFLIGLDNTIISTAIPKITDRFHALEDVGWYGSAYLLTTCAFQLAWGKLYTFYPVKWIYLIALFVFEAGSLICAVSPTSVSLIIGRAIAGIGTGGTNAGAYLLVALCAPKRQMPTLVGLVGGMYGIASAAGPLLGGVFTDSSRLTWRWCFYINLPLGFIAAGLVIACVPSSRVGGETKTPRSLTHQVRQMDLPGTVMLVPSVICFLLALQWGGAKYAWTNARIVALLVVAACLFIAFLAIQIRSGEQATVPPRIFCNRNIWGSAIFGACLTACFFVMLYYLPIWFQAVKAASAVKSGIMNLPMVLGFVVFSALSGAVVSTMGYYIQFVYLSLILMAIGTGLLSTLTVNAGPGSWIGYQVLLGAGVGIGLQTPITAVQTALDLKDIPTGTAAVIFCETLAGGVMVSVAQNVFANQLRQALRQGSPGLDLQIADIGATELEGRVSPGSYPIVLNAYNRALTRTFYVAVGLACCSVVGAVCLEPLKVGRKGGAEDDS